MKIGFLISDLNAGGAERAAVSLANHFATQGHDIEIITFKDIDSFYTLNSKVRHLRLGFDEIALSLSLKRIIGAFGRMLKIRSFVKKRKLDVLIGMSFSMTWYTVFATKFTKTKAVGTERNNPFKYKANKINSFLRKFFYKYCDGYVFQTQKASTFFTEKLKDRDIVIPNAIFNETVYELTLPIEREKLICAVGRLNEQKRFDILIDAFASVSEKIPEHKMIIFGEGELRDELEKRVASYSLEDRISLPGTNPQSVQVVNKADVFVLSSDLEGMPNVLMEAMAMGVPCVSTRCDMGPEELIENGENGILVDVGNTQQIADSILEIISNPTLSQKLSINARRLLKTHSIEAISEKWLDFLKSI